MLLAPLVAGVVLYALELAARALSEPVSEARGIKLVYHPTRIWTLGEPERAATYRLTPDGRRRSARDVPAGTPVILTLGDSSMFGDGVPDGSTIHDVLATELLDRGLPADVQTIAVPGYSTEQTLRALDEIGWALGPRLLVVGNLWSDATLDQFRDRNLMAAASAPLARAEDALTRLALYRQARRGVNTWLDRPASRRISWPQPGSRGMRRVELARYVENYRSIYDGAKSRGIGVVVLSLAGRSMVDVGLSSRDTSEPYVRAQVGLAVANRVPHVSATDAMSQSGLGLDHLFGDDVHPSPEGAAVLGKALANTIVGAGWPEAVPVPSAGPPFMLPPDPYDNVGEASGTSVQRRFLDR